MVRLTGKTWAAVLGVVLTSSLGACGPSQPAARSVAEPAPEPPAEVAPVPAEASRDAGGEEARKEALVQQMLAAMAEIRELPARGPVRGEVVSRQYMVEHVGRQLQNELPNGVIRATEALLTLLNVVPEGFDYQRSLLGLMTAQLAGFYEPKNKTMYLAADLEGPESRATLSHELVHALQDQHYDLAPRIKYREDGSDEQSAFHALAEGDATSAMLDRELRPRGVRAIDLGDRLIELEARAMLEMSEQTAEIPNVLKRSVIAPYADGVRFVHWARRTGGWAKVDQVWRSPPVSTEQLLHPEKYEQRELPETVDLPPPPAVGGWTMLYHDVLGEQSLRIVLEDWLSKAAATEAASDWGGDRVAVFESNDRVAAAWHLRFDSERAAKRADRALRQGLLAPPKKARAANAPPAPATCVERRTRGPAAVVSRGRDIAVVLGPSGAEPSANAADPGCGAALAWAARILAGARP